MDILTAIFGNQIKIKILRLFLFNPEISYFLKEIIDRTNSPAAAVRKEINTLLKAGLLKKKVVSKDVTTEKKGKVTVKKVQGPGFALNTKFIYIDPLKTFLTISSVSADEALIKKFASVGRVKFFVASGVFIQNWDARVDILIVGDDLDLNKIENVIKGIEAELGKEISYSAFETADFEYRLGIHDRLIRDILDYPHITLLDRLGVEPQ